MELPLQANWGTGSSILSPILLKNRTVELSAELENLYILEKVVCEFSFLIMIGSTPINSTNISSYQDEIDKINSEDGAKKMGPRYILY